MSIYGLLIGIGVVIAIDQISRAEKKLKWYDFLIILFSTLFFSRLLFDLHNISEIRNGLINPFAVYDGGLTIYGAILGALLSILILTKIRKINFFKITDTLFIYIPLAQAIGRWGNFFNHELYGKPTNMFWGINIPKEYRLPGYESYNKFQPVFFFESLFDLTNFGILKILSRKKIPEGLITSLYLIIYGCIRIGMNILRIDKEYFLGIETSDLFSVLSICIGTGILINIVKPNMKQAIAQFFSKYVTLGLILAAVISIVLKSQIIIKYDILLVLFTFVIPIFAMFLFRVLNITSDFNVTNRKDRPKLFIFMGISFLAALYVAQISNQTNLITSYLVLDISFFIGLLITLFWKISYHMIWSIVSIFVIIYTWNTPYLYLLALLLPFIAWSRVELKRHTTLQVIAGSLLASLSILIVLTLL